MPRVKAVKKQYRTIVIDPPWLQESQRVYKTGRGGRGDAEGGGFIETKESETIVEVTGK
jgi:hypothetical protein